MKKNTIMLCILAAAIVCPDVHAAFEKVDLPDADNAYYSVVNFLPDGRTVVYDGYTVWNETAVGSGAFAALGTVGAAPGGSDPGFIVSSVDGSQMIIGQGAGGFTGGSSNGLIYSMPATGGPATLIADVDNNYAAAFRSSTELYVDLGDGTFGGGSFVSVLDLTSGSNSVVIDVPGGSGGVAVDSLGRLYVAIGYDATGVRTGEIRRFAAADIQAALTGGFVIDYDTGLFITRELSASSLAFINDNLLICGGSDSTGTSGRYDYFAVIDVTTGATIAKFDPDPTSEASFYSVAYNAATQQMGAMVSEYWTDAVMYRTGIDAIPEPALMLILPAFLLAVIRKGD